MAGHFDVAPPVVAGCGLAILGVALHTAFAQSRRSRALERRLRELGHDIDGLHDETEATRGAPR